MKRLNLCPCHPMDCSPPGSSVHRICQARTLEWVAISFSRGSSWPRVQNCISCIGRRILSSWASREAHVKRYKVWNLTLPLLVFSDSSIGKKSTCNAGDPSLIPGSGRSPAEEIRLTASIFWGFPCGSVGKESAYNVGDQGLIPGLGRSPEGKGYSLQYFGLENSQSMGVTKSQTQLSKLDFHFHHK